MTCEKTERVFPLNIDIDIDIYLIDIEPTGYNISLQSGKGCFQREGKIYFYFHMQEDKSQELILKQGRLV